MRVIGKVKTFTESRLVDVVFLVVMPSQLSVKSMDTKTIEFQIYPPQVSEGYAVLANLYGTKINSVVSEVHRLLQISENSPAWHSYILYLDNLISSGIYASVPYTIVHYTIG